MSASPLVQLLPGALGKALESTISADEELLASIHTARGEAIAVTDTRVVILKAGYYANAGFFAKKAISYTFRDISSVEHREGPLGGHVKILVAGVLESGSGNVFDGHKSYGGKNRESENIVTYQKRTLRETLREVVSLIQGKVLDARSGAIASSTSSPSDISGQIAKLAQLHTDGILSNEEFSSAKRRIINE